MKTNFLNEQKQKEEKDEYRKKKDTILFNLYSLNTEQAIKLVLEAKADFDTSLEVRLKAAIKEQTDIETYLEL